MSLPETTPVLIGAGQFTYKGEAAASPKPLDMVKLASARAAGDAGLGEAALARLDAIGVVGFTIDTPGALAGLPVPRLANPPAALARALGANPRWLAYTQNGGNSPQQLINTLCERIAAGENELALAVGAEFLGSVMRRLRQGIAFDGWGGEAAEAPQRLGEDRPGVSEHEAAHGLALPVNTYPLFENALRARDKRSLADHQARIGRLFASFTTVAAANPYAWFPTERSAQELVTVGPANRMVSFPYPKYLNAIMQVDQSAGVLIASLRKARELGVAEERMVFLHGCADAADLWFPLERQNYYSSPAIRLAGKEALEMAGVGVDDLAFIDLYSCFPSAVEIAAEELGLAIDDRRRLTVTGGLPYFGGPGNNYSMHAVATLMDKLRQRPGAFGLSTANGWYLTKQSVGIYSTTPPEAAFARPNSAALQRQIDVLPHPAIVERPSGEASVETYTVVHRREGYRLGIVIGRDQSGARFVANTPDDEATLAAMERGEQVGRRGQVRRHEDGVRNLFLPG
ncbi:MAG TPA: acetyl-CoA acetyltransferase [Caulobacteraceae bacterium]|nr:acetyl-CoA acetyltransferase [Caulobacteraceae bacterium]